MLEWGNADLAAWRGTVSTGMPLAELNSLNADTPNVGNGPRAGITEPRTRLVPKLTRLRTYAAGPDGKSETAAQRQRLG